MNHYGIDDYTHALQNLMPTGMAWPRNVDGIQYALLRALAQSFHATDVTAHELLTGAFPPTATMLLPEWEATLGLPDDCAIGDKAVTTHHVLALVIATSNQWAKFYAGSCFCSCAALWTFDRHDNPSNGWCYWHYTQVLH